MADKFNRVSEETTPVALDENGSNTVQRKSKKQNREDKEEDTEFTGPKFLGCMSIRTGFIIFGLSDIALVITGSIMIREGIIGNVLFQTIFYLLFVPQVLMFVAILVTDNIMTRTIGYYLLIIKIVAQITVFPVLLLRLDQIRIGKFVCTKVFPAFKNLDFLSGDG
jgi:hypothetical protein